MFQVVPLDRWDVDDHPEHQLGRFGGFIAGWAEFDAGFFSIAPTEAALMDPSQRLLLQVAIYPMFVCYTV